MSRENETVRNLKHMILVDSIEHMEVAVNNTEKLLGRITNDLPKDRDRSIEETDGKEPSLVLVLNEAPDTINALADKLTNIINDIHKQLF